MEQAPQSNYAAKVMERYKDAYLVARATTEIGRTIKIMGFVFGGIVALIGFAVGSQGYRPNPVLQFGGLILGAMIAIPLFVLGVLIAAQGQVLKANLDEAVHTSPFLTDDQRASVMSLREPPRPNPTTRPPTAGRADTYFHPDDFRT